MTDFSPYHAGLYETREDRLCNELIDIYLEEKRLREQQSILIGFKKASQIATGGLLTPPSDLQRLEQGFTQVITAFQDNILTSVTPAAAGLAICATLCAVGAGLVTLFGYAQQSALREKQTALLELEYRRYCLTFDNPHIFPEPHITNPAVLDIYKERHPHWANSLNTPDCL